jgi:hypothetical protein
MLSDANRRIGELEAHVSMLERALREIRTEQGKVCQEFETCDHIACRSSYTAWVIADTALLGGMAQ